MAMRYNRPAGKAALAKVTWDLVRQEKMTPAKPTAEMFVSAVPDHLLLTYNATQLQIGPKSWIGSGSIGTMLQKCSWEAVVAACDYNRQLSRFLEAGQLLAAMTTKKEAVLEAEQKAAGLFFGEACQRVEVLEQFRQERIAREARRRAYNASLAGGRLRRHVTRLTERTDHAQV